MEQIKRFFECLIPVTVCNLKCSYCYVIQRDYRNMKLATMKYSPEQITQGLTKERLGGVCYFSICGAGETLAQPETFKIAKLLLREGHIVNITTNGTLTNRFHEIVNIDECDRKRLHFSFSLHYLELQRLRLLDRFFENIKLVHEYGCSYMVQLNLCDEYIPFLDEIKQVCLKNVGAYPQIAVTRKEGPGIRKIQLHTELSEDEYRKIGNSFNSELFKYTMENFNVKRKEFCYAGERSGTLNLGTGILTKCYADPKGIDIFENISKPIKLDVMGHNCGCAYCLNSSHFMSLGVIDNDDKRTYVSIRDRSDAQWFNDTLKSALSQKLWDSNEKYSSKKMIISNLKQKIKMAYYRTRHKVVILVKWGIRK
ncbi:radical SAM protein [Hungatella sp. L12]|uniref:Radical SAM protein n=1 Tax=Hungatella hominis TaxID=2763050 RepID=A0ABR7HBK1_9FIRM|nr:radical SAM protein [Hungatella hominis]MBC5710561.1 radical SAM protein [Hungatella hominis]